jgi:hypothetical protein
VGVLKVKVTDLRQALSDGTRKKYELISIISITKERDSTQFQLYLSSKRYYHQVDSSEQEMDSTFSKLKDSTFLYFNSVEIEVPPAYKKKFESILEGKMSVSGTFTFIDQKRIRLIKL